MFFLPTMKCRKRICEIDVDTLRQIIDVLDSERLPLEIPKLVLFPWDNTQVAKQETVFSLNNYIVLFEMSYLNFRESLSSDW